MKMLGRIISDSSNEVHVDKHPRRNLAPTTKLLDKNNIEQAGLPFQQKYIDHYRAAREAQDMPIPTSNLENPGPEATSHTTSPISSQIPDMTSSPPPSDHVKDKRHISEVDTSDDSDSAPDSRVKSTDRPQKKKDM
jgi:hypothetical protein